MVDIKELMRTYVFINDPDIKKVTTKFGALLLAIGAIASVVWVAAGAIEDTADQVDDSPAASEAGDGSDGADTTGGDDASSDERTEACMAASDLPSWEADHPELVESGDYEVRQVDTGIVCVYY